MRFEHAYVQRHFADYLMTLHAEGRFMFARFAQWRSAALAFSGDYLRPRSPLSARYIKQPCGLLRLCRSTPAAQREIEAGFEAFERDDGMSPDPILRPDLRYNQYLRERGYDPINPWDRNANGGLDEQGNFVSGWQMRNAHYPANIKEEDSETPYMTSRAIEFIAEAGEQPWCLHLSYIKPHWPYIAPAPYHNLYGAEHVVPAVRNAAERLNAHPVYDAFMHLRYSQEFSRDEVRQAVIPVYMGWSTDR